MVLMCVSSVELIGYQNMEKWVKNTHSGHFSETCTGTLCVLVIFGQCVPVHIRGVPVHPVLLFLF